MTSYRNFSAMYQCILGGLRHVFHVLCDGFSLSQAMFAEQSREGAEKIIATTQAAVEEGAGQQQQSNAYSLKDFSIDHFRPPPKRTLSRTLSRSGFKRKGEEIWNYTRVRLSLNE